MAREEACELALAVAGSSFLDKFNDIRGASSLVTFTGLGRWPLSFCIDVLLPFPLERDVETWIVELMSDAATD
jgi:hypothetical protein